MQSSYLTCNIHSVYYRVSNKASLHLLIFDLIFLPTTPFSQSTCLLIFQVQTCNNMNHFSHVFVCQICKKCRSFNLSRLTNKLNFKSLQQKSFRELDSFGLNSQTVCISLRLSFNKLNENFRPSHCDVHSKINSFVGEF